MNKIKIEFDTYVTIILTALLAIVFQFELGAPAEGFIIVWLWAMIMAVLLRKISEHV